MSRKENINEDYWPISSDYSKVDPKVAQKIGFNEAVILRTIYGMCRWKKENDGTEWFQGSRAYWVAKFRWLSISTFRRIINKLHESELIDVRIENKRGNYYRPRHENIKKMLEKDSNEEPDQAIESAHFEPTHEGGSAQFEPGGRLNLNQGSAQFEPTLLNTSNLVSNQVSNIPTAYAVEVFESQKSVDKVDKASKERTGGSLIFEAYALAYSNRYGFEPPRGKEANRWAKKIYEEVGVDEGCSLVQHYVEMNKAWFIQKGHSLEWCFRELTEVKRSFNTGVTMTSSQIKQIENQQTVKETTDEIQHSNGELASAWSSIDTKRTIKI